MPAGRREEERRGEASGRGVHENEMYMRVSGDRVECDANGRGAEGIRDWLGEASGDKRSEG